MAMQVCICMFPVPHLKLPAFGERYAESKFYFIFTNSLYEVLLKMIRYQEESS